MALSLCLPEEYGFKPDDGHAMALRLECFNSVDGSTRLRALMGWFRFVCRNGLIIGVTRSDLHRRHVGDLRLEDVDGVLSDGLGEAETDQRNFGRWLETGISRDALATWANGALRKEWGFKAAARAFHIAITGLDATVVGPYKGCSPTTVAMQASAPVPGAPPCCRHLFDLSQCLAWLAKERRDVQEQLEWRERIPSLLASSQTGASAVKSARETARQPRSKPGDGRGEIPLVPVASRERTDGPAGGVHGAGAPEPARACRGPACSTV